jgi:hypothetical protein
VRRFAAFLVACAAGLARAQGVELFLADDGTPTARIAPPPGADEIRFAPDPSSRTHALARRSWSFDAACFALAGDRLRVLDPKCGAPVVRLEWEDRIVDRMYPPVVRLANGGVLVFTQYLLALGAEGREASWTIKAPPGGIAVAEGTKGESVTLRGTTLEDDGRAWVYLGPDAFREEEAGRVLVDDGVPAHVAREMTQVAPRLLAFLESRLGPTPARPMVFVTWAQRDSPARDVQADVVPGGVIRFGLRGADWAQANAAGLADFRFLVAHELAHLWNGGKYRAAPWATPWIAEGGAELFAIASLVALGAMDERDAADRIAAAIGRCSLTAAGRAWPRIPERDRGHLPYTCGLALQFTIVALARRGDDAIDPFSFWARAWKRWPRYYESVPQQQLAAAGDAEAATMLQEMLTVGTVPLAHALGRALRAAGVTLTRLSDPGVALTSALGGNALMALMQSDCAGNASFYSRPDHFAVAELPCAHFREGMRVRFLEERDLVSRTVEAVEAARAACRERGKVRVGLDDGGMVEVPCVESSFPDPGVLVQLRPREVRAILLRREPGA